MEQPLPTLLSSPDRNSYLVALATLCEAQAEVINVFTSLTLTAGSRQRGWNSALGRTARATGLLLGTQRRALASADYGANRSACDIRASIDLTLYALAPGCAGHLTLPVAEVAADVPASVAICQAAWADFLIHLANISMVNDSPALAFGWDSITSALVVSATTNHSPTGPAQPVGGTGPLAAHTLLATAIDALGATNFGLGIRIPATPEPQREPEHPGRLYTFALPGARADQPPHIRVLADRLEFLGLTHTTRSADVTLGEQANTRPVLVPGDPNPSHGAPALDLPLQQADIERAVAFALTRQRPARIVVLDADVERAALYGHFGRETRQQVITGPTATDLTPTDVDGSLLIADFDTPAIANAVAGLIDNGISTPVIAVTTNGSDGNLRQIHAVGVRHILLTPLNTLSLAEKVEVCLDEMINGSIIYDANASLNIARGRLDLADEMLTMFISGVGPDIELIDSAVASRDIEMARTNIHRLRGAVEYCSVPRFTEVLEALYAASRAVDWAGVVDHLNRLRAEAALLACQQRNTVAATDPGIS